MYSVYYVLILNGVLIKFFYVGIAEHKVLVFMNAIRSQQEPWRTEVEAFFFFACGFLESWV